MTGRRGYRRRRNSTSAIFPGINPAPYQSSNQYPFPQYMSGTGGGYPTGGSTSGLSSIFNILGSNYRSSTEEDVIICNGFKLKGGLGYLLLKNLFDDELLQIDCEGMYKYHFFNQRNYDADEDGALIILDEGFL